ncbi:MAG: hypothetical protein EA392_01270 [Cryomorphaceae bacterium]|nr:MAG: hypothetical protein EA392_01270 [Cryomorphaceae bacterium]
MWRLISIMLFAIVSCNAGAQNFLMRFGGPAADEAMGLARDGDNNTYLTGYYSGAMSLVGLPSLESAGLSDVYVLKIAPNGVPVWAFSGGGNGPDRAHGLALAADGSVYVTGFFSGTAAFGDFVVSAAPGSQDVFLLKLSSEGEAEWLKTYGGDFANLGNDITVDISGNILVTGQFRGQINFEGTVFNSLVSPDDNDPTVDIFVLKVNPEGDLLWVKHGQATGDSRGLGIDTDAANNVYVCGQYSDTLTFDTPTPNDILSAGFVAKFNENGAEQWVRTITSSQTTAYDIAVHSSGDVFVCGNGLGVFGFIGDGAGQTFPTNFTHNTFLCKMNSNGNLQWLTHEGSENPVSGRVVGVDELGGAYVGGTFRCRMDEYSAEFGTGIFYSAGFDDVFISGYSSQGERLWSRHSGSVGVLTVRDMIVDGPDLPVICGGFHNALTVTNAGTFSPISGNQQGGLNPPLCGDMAYGNMRWVNSAGGRDAYVTSPINLNRQPLDYFLRPSGACERPYLFPCVQSCVDSLASCIAPITLLFDDPTIMPLNPAYTLEWTAQNTTPPGYLVVEETDYYISVYSREDGCIQHEQIIHFEKLEIPVPIVAHNMGAEMGFPPDVMGAHLCLPDTVTLTGSNVNPGDQSWWIFENMDVVLPGENENEFHVFGSTQFSFNIQSENGCIGSNESAIAASYPINDIDLTIAFPGYDQTIDTVFLCPGESFLTVMIIPPDAENDLLFIFENGSISWSLTSLIDAFIFPETGPTPPVQATILPNESGYIVTNIAITSLCNDSITHFIDSIYVHMYPEPDPLLSIEGPNQICPGDTVVLVGSGFDFDPTWGGANFIEVNDSTILAWEPGAYSLNATVINEFGCMAEQGTTFFVSFIDASSITMVPSNGVICPGDSVQLISEPGLSYTWIGPMGNVVGTSQDIYVNTPGFYSCILTSFSGCKVESNILEVAEYSTPFVIPLPGNDLCLEGQVELQVVAQQGAVVQWDEPISSNSLLVTVTEPGVYSCQITLCGITTTQFITIYETEVNAIITSSGPSVICDGDSLLLTANPGMASYQWLPGMQSSPQIWVTEPGTYSLNTTDFEGCVGNSNPLVVTTSSGPVLNQPDTVLKCVEDSVLLEATANFVVYSWNPGGENNPQLWAIAPGAYSLTVTDSLGCVMESQQIWVENHEQPQAPTSDDILHCAGDDFAFQLPGFDNVLWWLNGDTLFGSSIEIEGLGNDTSIPFQVIDNNGCLSPTEFLQVFVLPTTVTPSLFADTTHCAGDTLLLETDSLFAASYLWTIDGIPLSQNPAAQWVSGSEGGSYTIHLTVLLGECASGTAGFEVNVVALPDSLPIIGAVELCEDMPLELSTELPEGQEAIWQWETGEIWSDNLFLPAPIPNGLNVQLTGFAGQCPGSTTNTTISVFAYPNVTWSNNSPVCETDSLWLMTNATEGWANIVLPSGEVWDDESWFTPEAQTADSGMYEIIVWNGPCFVSEDLWLEVWPQPPVWLSGDTLVCAGVPLQLPFASQDSVWLNGLWLTPPVVLSPGMSHSLAWINEYGCISEGTFDIETEACDGEISNVFSPNSDGINDVFLYNPFGYIQTNFRVFNRWGQEICHLINQNSWDGIHCKSGRVVSDGVYFYTLEYIARNQERGVHKGSVHVLR